MKDNVRLGAQDLQQLQHLVEALDATVIEVGLIQRGSPTRPTPTSKLARGSSGKFPPPYPESIAENQRDDGDDRSMHSFPPPYVKTTPAFWTFDSAIDPPTPSIAKLRAVPGTDRRAGGGATTPRSTAKSPGWCSLHGECVANAMLIESIVNEQVLGHTMFGAAIASRCQRVRASRLELQRQFRAALPMHYRALQGRGSACGSHRWRLLHHRRI